MTEDWIARELAADWAEVPQTDLETVVALGRTARRRRRRLQGGGAALACALLVAGGVAAAGAANRSHPAAIGPADQPTGSGSASLPAPTLASTSPPTLASTLAPTLASTLAPTVDPGGLSACAGADTPTAVAVGEDVVALTSSDYRHPAVTEAAMAAVATGDLSTQLAQQQPALTQILSSSRNVSTAKVDQIGYVSGGCAHPVYLVAVSLLVTQMKQASPSVHLEALTVRVVLVDGTYKADSLKLISPDPPSATPTP